MIAILVLFIPKTRSAERRIRTAFLSRPGPWIMESWPVSDIRPTLRATVPPWQPMEVILGLIAAQKRHPSCCPSTKYTWTVRGHQMLVDAATIVHGRPWIRPDGPLRFELGCLSPCFQYAFGLQVAETRWRDACMSSLARCRAMGAPSPRAVRDYLQLVESLLYRYISARRFACASGRFSTAFTLQLRPFLGKGRI